MGFGSVPGVSELEAETRRQVDEGVRPAIHAYVEHAGTTVADVRAGPIDEATLFYTFSAVKAVQSIAAAQLADRGLLDFDQPVATYIPEFAQAGKQDITVRQLITHRAGLPDGPADGALRGAAWYYLRPFPDQIADICAAAPEWEPGTAHGYHGLTLQPLLCELIARISGRAAPDYMREEVFAPLGVTDFFVGLPPEHDARRAAMVDLTGAYPQPLVYNLEAMHRWPCGGFTNAAQFARVLRGLLDAVLGKPSPLMSGAMAREMTAIHVAGFRDRRLGGYVPWGMGLSVKPAWSTAGRGMGAAGMFGTRSAPGSFGHAGNIYGSTAFADPVNDVTCVVMTNGLLAAKRAAPSMRCLVDAAYADAGV